MSIELKDLATKLRKDAATLDQESARLKSEAKMLREAAYTLSPIGRKPGSRARRRRKPVVRENGAESAAASLVIDALRENGEATADQLARDVGLALATVEDALIALDVSEKISKDSSGEGAVVYHARV